MMESRAEEGPTTSKNRRLSEVSPTPFCLPSVASDCSRAAPWKATNLGVSFLFHLSNGSLLLQFLANGTISYFFCWPVPRTRTRARNATHYRTTWGALSASMLSFAVSPSLSLALQPVHYPFSSNCFVALYANVCERGAHLTNCEPVAQIFCSSSLKDRGQRYITYLQVF